MAKLRTGKRDHHRFIANVDEIEEVMKIGIGLPAFADIGTDELILYPAIAELDQVHRLAEIVEGNMR